MNLQYTSPPRFSHWYPPKHPLFSTWTLYFDSPQSKSLPKTPQTTPAMPQGSHGWMADIRKVVSFDSVEEFWGLYNNIIPPSQLPGKANYYLFKVGSSKNPLISLWQLHRMALSRPGRTLKTRMVENGLFRYPRIAKARGQLTECGFIPWVCRSSPFSVICSFTVDACCDWWNFRDTLYRLWKCPFPHSIRSHHRCDRLPASCLVSCFDLYFTSRVPLEIRDLPQFSYRISIWTREASDVNVPDTDAIKARLLNIGKHFKTSVLGYELEQKLTEGGFQTELTFDAHKDSEKKVNKNKFTV